MSIFTVGMMGDKFLEIDQTESSGDYVKPGETLIGNDALSIEIIQQNFAKLTKDVYSTNNQKPKSFMELMNGINRNIWQYSRIANSLKPSTYKSIKNFETGSSNVMGKIENSEDFLKNMYLGLKSIKRENIKVFFAGINELKDNLYDLNNSLTNYIELIHNLNQQITVATKQDTLMGQLIFSRKFYNDLENQFEAVEAYSKKLAEEPNYILMK